MSDWLGKQVILNANIVKVTDDSSFPPVVEAEVVDFTKKVYQLVDKLTIFTSAELDDLPMRVGVVGTVVDKSESEQFEVILLIDTEEPHHIYDKNNRPLRIWVGKEQIGLPTYSKE